jgi:hypothetical protein
MKRWLVAAALMSDFHLWTTKLQILSYWLI